MVWYELIISIIACLAAGFIGSFFTRNMSWYKKLKKPSFNPPSYIFAPVWTILYILMGVSLYLMLNNQLAVILFIIQLILNVAWSYLFFRLHKLLLASIDIVILLVMIICTAIASPILASYLLIPYILWVAFATVLTWSVYLLNR